MWYRLKRRKVPKVFLAPRPMSGGLTPRSARWHRLPSEVLALVVAAGLVLTTPLSQLDDWLTSELLTRAGAAAPPAKVALVTISMADAQDDDCGQHLADFLIKGGAKAALLLEPAGLACRGALAPEITDSEAAPPIAALKQTTLRKHSQSVIGFRKSAKHSLLRAVGVSKAKWVAPRAKKSVPKFALGRSNHTDANWLLDRVVIVEFSESGRTDIAQGAAVTAALSAAIEDPRRRTAPTWLVCLIAVLGNAALILVQRRAAPQRHLMLTVLFGIGLLLPVTLLGILGFGRLMPLPTLLTSLAGGYLLMHLPQRAALSRADQSAVKLLRAAKELAHSQAPRALSDEEFWARLSGRAAAAHACDDVLLAELPAFSWRLRFWSNGELTDSIIRERRRDIRRMPYADEHGAPTTTIIDDYLVMKDTPALLVPLIAKGDVEGYLLLIGRDAVGEYTQTPEKTEHLADDLAALIHRRRLARAKDSQDDPRSLIATEPAADSTNMLDGARAAIEELRLLSALVRHSPVGLFYVDSFGDIRLLGQAMQKWLPEFGIKLPRTKREGALEPGQLPLTTLLRTLAHAAHIKAPSLSDLRDQPYSMEVPVQAQLGRRVNALKLSLVRLDSTGDSIDGGTVGSLSELAQRSESTSPRISQLPQRGDPLVVFSLAQLLARLVADVANRGHAKIKLQTPRDLANVVAHQTELKEALDAFLLEVAQRSDSDEGPVLSIKERKLRVEVTIMDLKLGVPASALRRALLAPSEPPAGLAELGQLTRAVENSHGLVTLRADSGWGIVLTLNFIRARPRVQDVSPAALINLKSHNTRPKF